MMAQLGGSLVVTVILGPIGALLLWSARAAARKKELIEQTPTTPIPALTPGFREAKGRIESAGGELLRSPMKNTTCVYYRFQVKEKRHKSGKHGHSHWVTVVDDVASVPFYISDGGGRALVETKGAEALLKADSRTTSGTMNDAPPELENLLQQRYGKSSQGLVFNKAMTYVETVLEVGDELYVLGEVKDKGGTMGFASGGEVFLITDGTEEALKASITAGGCLGKGLGWLLLAIAFGIPALVLMKTR